MSAAAAPVGEWTASDDAALEALAYRAPLDVLERLGRRHCARSALRSRRLDLRKDALIRMALRSMAAAAAAALGGSVDAEVLARARGEASALADAVHGELLRYSATAAWQRDRDRETPGEARHALAHSVLKHGRGAVLAAETMRPFFADLGTPSVGKKRAGNAHGRGARSAA